MGTKELSSMLCKPSDSICLSIYISSSSSSSSFFSSLNGT